MKGKSRKTKINQVWHTSGWLSASETFHWLLNPHLGSHLGISLLHFIGLQAFQSVSGKLDCVPALFFPIGSCFSSCHYIYIHTTSQKWVGANMCEAIFIVLFVAPGVTLPLWHPMGSENYPVVMAFCLMSVFSFFRMVWLMRQRNSSLPLWWN